MGCDEHGPTSDRGAIDGSAIATNDQGGTQGGACGICTFGDCCGVEQAGELRVPAARNVIGELRSTPHSCGNSNDLRYAAIACPHCNQEHHDSGVYSTFNHLWHVCQACGQRFSAGYRCVGVRAADIGVAGQGESSPLLMLQVKPVFSRFAGSVLGLVDSGASYNFVSAELCRKLGWKVSNSSSVLVRLANGKVLRSQGTTVGVIQVGPWRGLVGAQVLDLSFDLVLGLPWLQKASPKVSWASREMFVQQKGRWLPLPVMLAREQRQAVVQSLVGGIVESGVDEASNRPLEVVSASKFVRGLSSGSIVHLGLVEPVVDGTLAFTHRAAYGSGGVVETSPESEALLDDIERKFPKVFREPKYPILEGRSPFEIRFKDESLPPARRKLYPLSELELAQLCKQVQALTDSGSIVPSSSPYGAPVLFAQKKGSAGLRMCVDYRSLNSNTVADSWPLPRIDELLGRLRGARVFSKLDLRDGYHQIPVRESDQEKTAFTCRYGTFHFKVMPFGVRNAPSHFQRHMNQLFGIEFDSFVVVYMDDVLIFQPDEASHREHVHKVFARLREGGWHVKRSKCSLHLPTVEFLGHTVGKDGVSVVSDKVGAVRDWPVPQSVRDVQAFLGLCNYYRRFIAGFVRVAWPLNDLTRKSGTFEWSEGCSAAFEQLKLLLTTAPILQVFDPECKHEVHVDASDFACGATLLQEQQGQWLPVEYYSHRFSAAESNYSATECKFVAVIQGLRRWRHYLLGRRFVVRTDHASLKWLQTQPQLSRRQVRWLDFLSEFDFEVQHIAGRANVVPDTLSRRPDLVQGQLGAWVAVHELESDLVTQLRDAQSAAAGQYSWDDLVAAATASQPGYELCDGLVYKSRGIGGAASVVVPDGATELKQELLRMHHDSPLSGHLGLYRMVQAMSQRYYWRGLYADVKRYCKECVTCQAAKVSTRASQGQLQPLSAPHYCFEQVTVDLITHLPTTSAGHDSICTFVDRLSKWVYFIPCSQTITADGLVQLFLSVVVAKHGMPRKLISDRDPRFMSKFWQALVRVLGCEHAVSTAYHPQTDGQTERFHRSVEQVLRCYVSSQQTNWDVVLPACEFTLNSTRSASTGYSPAFVLYGREPVLPLEQAVRDVVDSPVQLVVDRVGAMQRTVEVVRQSLQRAATYMAEYANRRRREVEVSVGGYAWLSTEHLRLPVKLLRKLAAKFAGPFRVEAAIGPVAFRLKLPDTWRIHNVFHVSQLKPAHGQVDGVDDDDVFRPPPDSDDEFEVDSLLDHKWVKVRGRWEERFLVHWKGYGIFESTWEPLSNLANAPEKVSEFRARKGLRASRRGG